MDNMDRWMVQFLLWTYVDILNHVTLGLKVQVSGSLSDIVARTEWILLSAYWKNNTNISIAFYS